MSTIQNNQSRMSKEYCPECDALVQFDYDSDEETYCEDCGAHDAVHCSQCDEVFDHVWGYDRIEKYQEERKSQAIKRRES